ncbi:MAG: hypothetical protein WBO29_15540 [Albidovulum sp.]
MVRILKLMLFLFVMGFVALAGFAYLGEMVPQRTDVSQPVELNVGN